MNSADVAVPLRPRSAAVLALASLAGLAMYCWPLLVKVHADDTVAPPLVFLLLLPLIIVIVLVEFTEDGMDAKALALLGVLTAINAVMRGLSAGTAGIELVFFLMILGGRVFGAGFGFVLGCTSLFASALLTGGVGPWLPFQMMASAWVGMGAGLLPRRPRGRPEIAMLVVYGILASYAYGLVTNMMGWPFLLAAFAAWGLLHRWRLATPKIAGGVGLLCGAAAGIALGDRGGEAQWIFAGPVVGAVTGLAVWWVAYSGETDRSQTA